MIAMEAWTVQQVKDTEKYTRVRMHEKVTLYIHKKPDRGTTQIKTEVYFYGPNHQKRAAVYAALVGGTPQRGNPSKPEKAETATTVVTWRDPL